MGHIMSKNSNTIIGILAGTAIGATLGVLFAPDKGSATRQRIADEANLQKERLANSAADLKDKVTTTVGDKKQTLEEQVDSLVSDASYKADDVISKSPHLQKIQLQFKRKPHPQIK